MVVYSLRQADSTSLLRGRRKSLNLNLRLRPNGPGADVRLLRDGPGIFCVTRACRTLRPKDLPSNREIRDQIQALANLYEGEKRQENL